MRGIDVFYQLCYFLSLNARNVYIQGRREYIVMYKPHSVVSHMNLVLILYISLHDPDGLK
jgi:hypothetical protein